MEQILKELGLYDLLAYFVTGAVALSSVIAAFVSFRRSRSQKSEMNLWQSETKLTVTLLVIGSYVLGHMIQVSGSMIDRDIFKRVSSNSIEQHYSGEDNAEFRKQLQAMVDKAFRNPPKELVFNLCQTYAQIRNIDSYIQIMQGRYAFFRGLAIAFLIGGVSFILKGYWDRSRASPRLGNKRRLIHNRYLPMLLLPMLFFLGALASFSRSNDFSHYFVDHVYRTFYVSYALSETEAGRTQ
ncbi:MAG TPA: hypothetical protein VN937_02265 [Blastocatellia bacterium]|nr:hypothetical protein [Blastocatellia bacterium]